MRGKRERGLSGDERGEEEKGDGPEGKEGKMKWGMSRVG